MHLTSIADSPQLAVEWMFWSFVVPLLPHFSDKPTSPKGNCGTALPLSLFTEHGLLVFSICVGKEDTHSLIYCKGNRACGESDGQCILGTPPEYKVQPIAPALRIWNLKGWFQIEYPFISHFLTFEFRVSEEAKPIWPSSSITHRIKCRVGPLPGWYHEVWSWHKRATTFVSDTHPTQSCSSAKTFTAPSTSSCKQDTLHKDELISLRSSVREMQCYDTDPLQYL